MLLMFRLVKRSSTPKNPFGGMTCVVSWPMIFPPLSRTVIVIGAGELALGLITMRLERKGPTSVDEGTRTRVPPPVTQSAMLGSSVRLSINEVKPVTGWEEFTKRYPSVPLAAASIPGTSENKR